MIPSSMSGVAAQQPSSELIALLEIGSNALRCVLARLDARPGVEILLEQRVQTRLGATLSGLLPPAAIDATVMAALAFLDEARQGSEQPRILAVATAAVRDAGNREQLLAPLRELGVGELRILSGVEEGELGAEAALRALPTESGMVADLGGGSLQLTLVKQGNIAESGSVPLGVVRLMRRFLEHDPATPAELQALRAEIRTQIHSRIGVGVPEGRVLASGGSVRALARLEISRAPEPKRPAHGYVLPLAQLSMLRSELEPLSVIERAGLRGLKSERADVIVAGAIVFEELLEVTGYAALTVCGFSVRDGVLWREAKKLAVL